MSTRKTRVAAILTFAVVAVAACSGCVSGRILTEPPQVNRDGYVVWPGDHLRISVMPGEEAPTDVMVRSDGKITYPLVDDVPVAGLTMDEIDQKLTKLLSEYVLSPEVTVSLEGPQSKRYFVFGEVGRAGEYPLITDITVVEAIGFAGGVTRRGSRAYTRLVRTSSTGEQDVIRVDVGNVLRTGDASEDPYLQPNDIIVVPPNAFAAVGYTIDNCFFPFQTFMGMGTQAASSYYTIQTGGAGRLGGYGR